MKKVSVSKLDKKIVEIILKKDLFMSTSYNIHWVLIEIKNDFINTEALSWYLSSLSNWSFHYFIPKVEVINNNNLLLIGFFGYISNLDLEIFDKKIHVYKNIEQIIDVLINFVNWEKTNLENHSLKWKPETQGAISEYLDSTFLINNSLSHWGLTSFFLQKYVKSDDIKNSENKEFKKLNNISDSFFDEFNSWMIVNKLNFDEESEWKFLLYFYNK